MLKMQIGTDAGRIWRYLDQKGEATIGELAQSLSMSESDVNRALGWLAREDKVFFYQKEENLLVVAFD